MTNVATDDKVMATIADAGSKGISIKHIVAAIYTEKKYNANVIQDVKDIVKEQMEYDELEMVPGHELFRIPGTTDTETYVDSLEKE